MNIDRVTMDGSSPRNVPLPTKFPIMPVNLVDANPRSVPLPERFNHAPFVSSVPDVSLVFNSGFSSGKDNLDSHIYKTSKKSHLLASDYMKRHENGKPESNIVRSIDGPSAYDKSNLRSARSERVVNPESRCFQENLCSPGRYERERPRAVINRQMKCFSSSDTLYESRKSTIPSSVSTEEYPLNNMTVNAVTCSYLHGQDFQTRAHTSSQKYFVSEKSDPKRGYVSYNSEYRPECCVGRNPHSIASAEINPQVQGNYDLKSLCDVISRNEEQCRILCSLLQKVVAIQNDQMNILNSINNRLSETTLEKPNNLYVPLVPFADVATQTSTVLGPEFCTCTKNEKKLMPPNIINVDIPESLFDSTAKDVRNSDLQEVRSLQDKCCNTSQSTVQTKSPEESLTLLGVCVPTVVGPPPSLVSTMHLHMHDYHSSASLNDNVTENMIFDGKKNLTEGVCSDLRGNWTFYNNIVDHVKKFFHTVPSNEEHCGDASQTNASVEAIRFAALERIRQLGISVYENSAEIKEFSSKRVQFGPVFHPSPQPIETVMTSAKNGGDASFGIHSLAMKYLRDDELCEMAQGNLGLKANSVLQESVKPDNISLATHHYLEKYHLLPRVDMKVDENYVKTSRQLHRVPLAVAENILDITTLKKQPKLI